MYLELATFKLGDDEDIVFSNPLRQIKDWRISTTMRTIVSTDKSKEECLRRALEYEWLAENGRCQRFAAYHYDRARLWRSLYYLAKPAELAEE